MLAEFPTEGANPELGIPESLRKPQNTPESAALGWDDMLSAQASVLVFEGANARPTLREGLVGLGFRAVRAVVYEMVPATASVLEAGEISCVNARELIAGAGTGSNSAAVDVMLPPLRQGSKSWWGRTQTLNESLRWQLSAARPPAHARS